MHITSGTCLALIMPLGLLLTILAMRAFLSGGSSTGSSSTGSSSGGSSYSPSDPLSFDVPPSSDNSKIDYWEDGRSVDQ